jgi:hypothetical protein
MDYKDDVKYQESCKQAVIKEIIVNTIQCGGHAATIPIWQEIARLGEGVYVQIKQSGGVTAVETPYDKKLAELGRKLDGTAVIAGEKKEQRDAARRMAEGAELAKEASGAAAADRAAYKAKKGPAASGSRDLVEEAEEGKLDLGKLKDEEMPEEMKKMSKKEQEKYVEQKQKEREEIKKQIDELSRKRSEYIDNELKKKEGAKDSFDKKVIDAVRKSAAEKGIKYEDEKKEAPKEKPEAPEKDK